MTSEREREKKQKTGVANNNNGDDGAKALTQMIPYLKWV